MVEQVATVLQVVFLSFLHVLFSEQVATVLQVPLDNLQLGRRGAAKAKQRARTEVVRLPDPLGDGCGSGNLTTRPEEPQQSEQIRDNRRDRDREDRSGGSGNGGGTASTSFEM